jgi:PAS domain S-box-containing protein
MILLLIGGAVPLLANAIGVAGIGAAWSFYDPTPLALLVSVALVPLALGRFRLLDLTAGDGAAAFAKAPEALLVLDDQRRVTGLSDRAAEMLDLPPRAIVGRRLDDLLPIDAAVTETGRKATIQIRLGRGEKERLLGVKVSPPREGGGDERVVALRDDTARARELTAAAVRYQELFDEHPQAILVHDPATQRIVSANRAAQRVYGYTLDELRSLSVEDLWAPADWRSFEAYAAAADGFSLPRPGWHRRRDGSVFEVEVRRRATSFGDAAARILIVEDVTDRREAERQSTRLHADITTAAALWRSTVDALQSPVVVLDGSDGIFRLNRAAASALGTDVRGAIGTPFAEHCRLEPWRAALEAARESRDSLLEAERHVDEPSEGRSWTVRASPVSGPTVDAGRRVVVLVTETTNVVQLQRKLDHEAAFARLGAIVAAVAHDVRGPLASLSVNLDALEIESTGDPGIGEALAPLHRQITRINDLMQALLDYGQPSGDVRVKGDLGQVVAAAVAARRNDAAEAGVAIEIEAATGMEVRMERPRIQQAIENLIANAVQHSPKDAVVRVEAALAEEAGARVARCSVVDRGAGFRPEDLPRVFEPFYSRRRGGTGLGLAIAHRVAEQHGGAVRAANVPGGGAVVTLELPLA